MTIAINQRAPDFCLLDQTGQQHCLRDCQGQWLLLYFYPKDDTPGCTVEACSFRDNWSQFQQQGLIVWGISTDNTASHSQFVKKYNLPFVLLADEEKTVVKQYDVWQLKKFMGRTYLGTDRTSFLIDPQGQIRKIYYQVKPQEQAVAVLADQQAMSEDARDKKQG
ncbi:MAG: thioredoxin-dependent thiol peroxidase [bacterium]